MWEAAGGFKRFTSLSADCDRVARQREEFGQRKRKSCIFSYKRFILTSVVLSSDFISSLGLYPELHYVYPLNWQFDFKV